MNSKSCLIPFTNVSISPRGTIRACCIQNDRELYGNWPKITDVAANWPTAEIQKIQKGMLSDDPENNTPECISCWREEQSGIRSYRQRYSKIWIPIFEERGYDPVKDSNIQIVDLQFGHLCNLSCTMCDTDFSSNLYINYKKLASKTTDTQLKEYYDSQLEYDHGTKGDWTTDDAAYAKLLKFCKDIESIRITGGEPLYNPRFVHFIKYLLEKDKPVKFLEIVTNGTIYTDEISDLLNRFEKLVFKISIESTEKREEFIRWPSVWSEKDSNLRKFISALKTENTEFRINHTVNALNAPLFDDNTAYLNSLSPNRRLTQDIHIVEARYPMSLCNSDEDYIDYCASVYQGRTNIVSTWMQERISYAKRHRDRNISLQTKYIMERAEFQNMNIEELFPVYFEYHKKYM